jgi:hypothetical protein
MITVIPRRYDAPKWQANVKAGEEFKCVNGMTIRNLFELKQFLSTLPDSVLSHHVSESHHDFADWIKNSVGDDQLSQEIRKNVHRWGMIVSLERQMMRTLNLPEYVAKRWLSPSIQTFIFHGGESVDSLATLAQMLSSVTDADVQFHLERVPNDIAKWVNDEIGDYQLAEILAESTSRVQIKSLVEDHLAMLHEAVKP